MTGYIKKDLSVDVAKACFAVRILSGVLKKRLRILIMNRSLLYLREWQTNLSVDVQKQCFGVLTSSVY